MQPLRDLRDIGEDLVTQHRDQEGPPHQRHEASDGQDHEGACQKPVTEAFDAREAGDRPAGLFAVDADAALDQVEQGQKTDRAQKQIAPVMQDRALPQIQPPLTAALHDDIRRGAARLGGDFALIEAEGTPEVRIRRSAQRAERRVGVLRGLNAGADNLAARLGIVRAEAFLAAQDILERGGGLIGLGLQHLGVDRLCVRALWQSDAQKCQHQKERSQDGHSYAPMNLFFVFYRAERPKRPGPGRAHQGAAQGAVRVCPPGRAFADRDGKRGPVRHRPPSVDTRPYWLFWS